MPSVWKVNDSEHIARSGYAVWPEISSRLHPAALDAWADPPNAAAKWFISGGVRCGFATGLNRQRARATRILPICIHVIRSRAHAQGADRKGSERPLAHAREPQKVGVRGRDGRVPKRLVAGVALSGYVAGMIQIRQRMPGLDARPRTLCVFVGRNSGWHLLMGVG